MPTDLIQSFRIDAEDLPGEAVIFGRTSAMREVRDQIERILNNDLPVLIRGESGTGKEVIAKFLHLRSDRHDSPFVKVNCGAIPAAMSEQAGPGYGKGIASAAAGYIGHLMGAAAGGTLFLDEIGDMRWEMQTKLLDLLEDTRLARTGAAASKPAVRVICSTNRALENEVARRAFRQDLFYRIDVINLNLAPLRERREDIPLLCQHFLDKLSKKFEKEAPALTPAALRLLKQWHWPGNVRELENRIARLIVLGEDRVLDEELQTRANPPRIDTRPPNRRRAKGGQRQMGFSASRPLLIKALLAHRWNRRQAAEYLRMSYRSFLTRLREAGVPQRRSRRGRRAPKGGAV